MKDETKDIDDVLNSLKNGTTVKFDKVVKSSTGDEVSEEEEKKKKDEKSEDNGDDPADDTDEEKKKKKKKPGSDDDESDDDDDTVVIATTGDGSSISAAKHKTKSVMNVLSSTYEVTPEVNKLLLARTKENISNVKKAMKKQNTEDSKQSEIYDTISKLCSEMNKVINDETKRSKYQDNGMSKALAMAFEPFTELSYVLLSMTPTKVWNDQYLIRTQDLLNEIEAALSRINNARTYSERVMLLLSLGSQYKTLFQTHPMIKGEINFINGNDVLQPWNINTLSDMWEYYLYDDNAERANGASMHYRGIVGDNAIQPDITLTKPFFLIFIDDELIYNLHQLHISDAALSVLGNYAMPTDLWNETLTDAANNVRWEPENETYRHSQIHTVNGDDHRAGEDEITIGDRRRNFTWSHNGTLNIISKTPLKLRARNDAFVNEVKALIDLATSKNIVEISEDVAFFMVLTNWLNATFKYMIDLNCSFMNYVDAGTKVDGERFISPYLQNIILKTLTSFTPDENSFSSSSIIDLLFDRMDIQYDKNVSNGFRYSDTAYQLLKKEFNSVTYTMEGDDEYFIGDAKVGNNKVVVTILQKLYLPIDILAAPVPVQTGFISSSFTHVQHTVDDPYAFGFAIANAQFNKRRGLPESAIVFNLSLFHLFCRMTNREYNRLINDALTHHTFQGLDNRDHTLNDIFGFHVTHAVDNENPDIPYLRVLSPLTPAYKRAALLHAAPCSAAANALRLHENGDYVNPRSYMQPLWDAAMQELIGMKSNWHGNNVLRGATLGWAIQALINEHADTSWIMMALILSQLKSTMNFRIIEHIGLTTTSSHITSLEYWINLLSNNDGTILNSVVRGGTAVPENQGRTLIYSTLMRRVGYYYSTVLKYECATMTNPYEKLPYIVPASSVSTADIIKAFRFARLHVNGQNVLIDNNFKMADKTCPKTIYYSTRGDGHGVSQIVQYSRLIRDGEEINITEDSIKAQLETPDFINENIIIFDNYHVAANGAGGANNVPQYNQTELFNLVELTPGVVPNTNFVGYQLNVLDHIIEPLDTDSKVDMLLNDVCYITSDFYVTSISYTVVLPLATYRSDASIANHEPANHINAFNNLRCFEILANAFHRCGFDRNDAQPTYSMLAVLCGIDANIDFRADGILIRDYDTWAQLDVNAIAGDPRAMVGFGIYGHDITNALHLNRVAANEGKDQFRSTVVYTDEQAESFNSSYRYPKVAVLPASTEITGMPIFFDYINNTVDNTAISSKKTKKFFDKLNSIVPDQGYGFYLRNNDENSALFNLALNGNPNYAGQVADQLIVSFTIRDILKKLDIFFRTR